MAHTTKENRDIYYRRSKEQGYRARSAYKLLQIFQNFHVLYPILDEEDARLILLNARCRDCQDDPSDRRFNLRIHGSEWHRATCLDSESDSDPAELPGYGGLREQSRNASPLTHYVETQRSCFDLGRVRNVIDLCSAPGSRSQLLRNLVYHNYEVLKGQCELMCQKGPVCRNLVECVNVRPAIVAIDLQQMAPIEGVHFLKGDITDPEVLERVRQLFLDNVSRNIAALGGCREELRRNAQLITCDGAPDVSGLHETDSFLQSSLIKSALSVCLALLDVDGAFVCKTFFGSEDTPAFLQVSAFFDFCTIFKPPASRPASFEHFVVGMGFKPLGHMLRSLSSQVEEANDVDCGIEEIIARVPQILAGDLSAYDALKCP